MSEIQTDAVAAVNTPAPEGAPADQPNVGKKPKLAKAKKTEAVAADGTVAEKKPVAPKRVSPHAGKFIYFNVANPAIGNDKLNPKRPGTKCHTAFGMYVESSTVEEQIKLWTTKTYTKKSGKEAPVGDLTDINWDVGHGFIVLEATKR